jgi:hypothetical protein
MCVTDGAVFAAGPPEVVPDVEAYGQYDDPEIQARMKQQVAAFGGRRGGLLMAVSKERGERLVAYRLESVPVFDGMAVAGTRLYMTMLDGTVVCLGAGARSPLAAAPDAQPGPTPTGKPTFVGTKAHPDFQRLEQIKIRPAPLGYHVETATGLFGVAVTTLPAPREGPLVLRTQVRPRPGAPPGTMGNAFLVFGDGLENERLMMCGFRISGQMLYLRQPPFPDGKTAAKQAEVPIAANQVSHMTVRLDPAAGTATFTMNDTTVETPLPSQLGPITCVGYAVSSVDAEFGPIDIAAP